jgi:hypothetical protein
MTSLYTPTGTRGLLALGALSIAIASAAWLASRPAPSPVKWCGTSAYPTIGPEPPPPEPITATITEVGPTAGCGVFVITTKIRYGNFGLVIPCIEFYRGDGLRFEVGDEHRLILDGRDRIHAIEWNGHRYPFSGYPAVVKRGFDGLTTNLVAETAGVSVGSVYQYFPTSRRWSAR